METPIAFREGIQQDRLLPASLVAEAGLLYDAIKQEAALPGQHVFFDVSVPAGAAPPSGIMEMFTTFGITVHAKTTLIDDKWAIIGSANCMRRSLYTDWEHSLAFIEGADNIVSGYRCKLWNEHFKHDNPAD